MKVLFIVPYSSEGASNRYRVEQYLPYLKAEGIEYDVRPFIFKEFYKILYLKGQYYKKAAYFIRALFNRLMDMFKLYKYDLVFIHREACPFGPPVFEWLIHMFGKPIVFDFDDAIFLQNFNPANSVYRFLKFASKTRKIIQISSVVTVANHFLEEYARKFNERVYVIPTPIDTKMFNTVKGKHKLLTIGWIGSPTTAPYLQLIYNSIQKLSQRYNFIFKVVGADERVFLPNVKVENCGWAIEREIQDFKSIDIGVYPLPDTTWTRGKAAFKAIQYMAVGVPVVASPVGMNAELIEEGLNGFLAGTGEEWFAKISRLIENPELREKIGLAGRKTVEEKFSVKVNAPKYIGIIKEYGPE